MQASKIQALQVEAPNILTVAGVFLAAVVLPHLPLLNLLTYPLTELNTLIHELGHAIGCLLTGGTVAAMTIVPDGAGHGGLTYCRGGIPFIFQQTGYLGTTIAGCSLIALAKYPRAAKIALIVLGATFGIASVTVMLQGVFTANKFQAVGSMVTGLLLAGAFVYSGMKLNAKWANLLLLFIGVQMGMTALMDTWNLILLSLGMAGNAWSDATNMARLTGAPAIIWALLWAGLSAWMLLMTISWAYDDERHVNLKKAAK